MRKGIMVTLLLVMLTILAAMPAYAAIRPNVVISGFSISKGAAAVGQDFVLTLKLTNTQPNTCAENILSTITAGSPFIMDGLNRVAAQDICGGETTTVDFPLKVDPTASGGFYQITVTTAYETSTYIQFSDSDTINLFVEGIPQLKASITDSLPLDVYAGDTVTVTFTIENEGSFEAQSVDASLKADAPLTVNWAKSSVSLGLLDAKESKTASFTLDVPKDAEAKDYPMQLSISYLDEDLKEHTMESEFFLHVKKKASFSVTDGTAILYKNDNSKIVELKLKNTGTDTAYKVKAKLLPQFPFSTDGSLRYVEQLEPGQEVSMLLSLDVDKEGTPGPYGLDMLFDFEDAQGKKLQDTAKLSLTVYPKSWFRAVFMDYWFGWIVVVLIVLMIARKRMKKKK